MNTVDVLCHVAYKRQEPLYLRVLTVGVELAELLPGQHGHASAGNVHHGAAEEGF